LRSREGRYGKITDLAKVLRNSPEEMANALERVLDEGGFGVALQSETGIVDARAALRNICRMMARQTYCLEVIARCAAVDHKTTLPDW
jgi:hypothetical protein